jgi:type I restriction enzyme S subunit
MTRLVNARSNHITRWVITAASKLLIDSSCQNVPTRPMAEVAHIEMGQSPVGDSCNNNGEGIPLIGGPADLGLVFPQTTRWTNAPTKVCKSGDIIVCVRATIGEPRWADGVYCLGRGVAGIRPTNSNLDGKFLFRIIEGNEPALRNQGTGTTFKTISKEHLSSIKVPMLLLKEQRAIGNFLEWLEQTGNTRPIFSKAPSLPHSLLNQLEAIVKIEELAAKVEEARGLRREAEEEADKLVSTKRAKIFENGLDNQDQVTSLENVAKLERGKFSHRPRNDPRFFGGNHPWIQIAEIEASNKYIQNWTQTLNDEGLAISRKFSKGTLLISIAATIGAVGILDFDCCVPDSIVAVTPRSGTISEYLYHYLRYLRSHLEKVAPQSAQKNINLEILSTLPIPVLDISEQRRIVAYLDDLQARVDALKQLQAETSVELDALLPSILDKAFRGEL